ncbi:MAG: hypothetical protein IKK91_00430 [Ruminococcus sp.]|nr:hypothetical protein [Ruminococcus sp.]
MWYNTIDDRYRSVSIKFNERRFFAMDIKEKLGDLTEKVKDKDFKDDLKKDPIKAVEGLTGIDIPEDKVDKVVDVAKDKLGDVFDKLKK